MARGRLLLNRTRLAGFQGRLKVGKEGLGAVDGIDRVFIVPRSGIDGGSRHTGGVRLVDNSAH